MNLKQFKARIISNKVLLKYPGAEYYLMDLLADDKLSELIPGQFVMLKCGGGTILRRPISIHSVKPDNVIELLYALLSGDQSLPSHHQENDAIKTNNEKGKKLLSRLKQNNEVDVIGPLGNGYKMCDRSKSLLLVAGGIGIAPLRFLAERATSMHKSVTLLMGARYQDGLYPRSLLPETINMVNIVETIDMHSSYSKGMVTDLLPQYVNDHDEVFACGPVAMYKAMEEKLSELSFERPVQISLEVRMGCGFGVCYGCSIKTRQGIKRVCKEGPVFNIKDIIWQEVKL